MVAMIDLAEKLVRYAMRLGPSDCDVLVAESRHVSAEIEKGSMKQANTMTDPGVAVRAFKDGSSGFSYCTSHDWPSVKKIAEIAVSQAKAGTPDPDFRGLPEKCKPAKVGGLFDPKVAKLEPDEIVTMAISLSDWAGTDKRITSVNASVGAGYGTLAFANSRGFAGSQRLSSFEVSMEAVARSGSKMFSGMDMGWTRKLDRSLFEKVGRSAMDHAIRGLNQTKLDTGDLPVVWDPLAVGFVLSTAIGDGTNAESVQRKRSYLAGRLGDKIGSEALTIVDDPTVEWAVGSYSFDGEGTRAFAKPLVENGRLTSYLYDSYTATKDSVESTGNSSRGGIMWSFRRPPSISSSNLVVKEGDSSLQEMLEETKKGVYLRLTYDQPNLATGEFSGLMMESFKIDKGELGDSIQQATIGIGLLELFSRIDMVGDESRDVFGVKTPAIRISKAKLAGSR
jgi:PmbA protein